MTPNSDGPDISHHNPVADWDAIPQYRLFSTKATEGRTFCSPTFDENWKQMRRRGFEFRGCYHWIRSDSSMKDQVDNLRRQLARHAGLQPGEFIQLDWETTPNIAPVSVDQVEEWLRLAEKYWPGGRVIVYGSDWVPGFVVWRRRNPTVPVWYANYNTSLKSTGGWVESKKYDAAVWQWTSSAPIPGIADPTCDMNHVFDWSTLERVSQKEEELDVRNYVAKPPAEREGMPWFTKINGVVAYATASDWPNELPVDTLSVEQYDLLFESVYGKKVRDVRVTNWPPPSGGSVPAPASFTLTGDIVANE